jgi:hypothetical protein
MPQFERYIGIDYSGAQTSVHSLPGLQVYEATPKRLPLEIKVSQGELGYSKKKYWSRKGIAEFLAHKLQDGPSTLVGIDHGFSFPIPYFETHSIAYDWSKFLDDFQQHWPTDLDHMKVDFIRNGAEGNGSLRMGNSRWRRLAEQRCGAKSVFHFDVQGSVAKSTHTGLPWLRYLRQQLGTRLHFWPFDGWLPPLGKSVIAEVYPALFSQNYSNQGVSSHQHDAYSVARWMRQCDREGNLSRYFQPELSSSESKQASIEGWILGLC